MRALQINASVHKFFSDFALHGELYIESVTVMCVVYWDRAPFMDRELQNGCEKKAISRLKGLYRILHDTNLEKLAKTTQVRSFCHIKSKWSQQPLNTHGMSTVIPLWRMRRALITLYAYIQSMIASASERKNIYTKMSNMI